MRLVNRDLADLRVKALDLGRQLGSCSVRCGGCGHFRTPAVKRKSPGRTRLDGSAAPGADCLDTRSIGCGSDLAELLRLLLLDVHDTSGLKGQHHRSIVAALLQFAQVAPEALCLRLSVGL